MKRIPRLRAVDRMVKEFSGGSWAGVLEIPTLHDTSLAVDIGRDL